MQPLRPPDVVDGGDKRKMNPCLPVKLAHQVGKVGASLAFSFGLLVEEEQRVDHEGIEHPEEGETRPSRVVLQ